MSTSGPATIHYLDGNQYLGCRQHYCCGYNEAWSAYWPNIAYFCPSCGELWARAVYEHHFSYKPIPQDGWRMEVRACIKCGDGTLLAGDFLDSASPELLTRELLALLERYHYE